MIPVVFNGSQQLDANSFYDHLIQICEQQKSEERALAFAFIVYDFKDHAIAGILKNKDYWSALDQISGNRLGVFYIDSQDSYYKRRQEEIYQDEIRRQERNTSSEKISFFLIPIRRKPTPIDNAINFIKTEFKLDENIKTPFVLFFQVDNQYNISGFYIVCLKQDRFEDAFLEIKAHIKNAVESLNKVRPEYDKNHKEIFNLIKGGVESGKVNDFINKKIKSKLGIETIFAIIEYLSGSKKL